MRLSHAEYALLGVALGSRLISPYKCDQDTLHKLWDKEMIVVSWSDETITITDEGRKAWADRPRGAP
jgi:hypothetical protein